MSTNEVMELTWDYENRLTNVFIKPSEDATPTGTFSYKYDALDRRIQKNINGKITSYIYDRENILLEHDGDGNLKAKYIHNTSAIDDVLVMEREDSPYRDGAYAKQEFYFHKDRLGNITEVTDYAGIVVQRYVYDAFGKVTIFDKDGNQITAQSPTYLENPYTFTGREYDPETGFYYYRARYYDPSSGRFLSEDPIGFAGGDFNLYRYVLNNPTNYVDPIGLYFERLQPNYLKDQVREGFEEFTRTYFEMRERELKNSDQYFHCLANCRAAKAGEGGRYVAELLSNIRELSQLRSDGIKECLLDQEANIAGRDFANSNQSCTQSCHGFSRNRLIQHNPRE